MYWLVRAIDDDGCLIVFNPRFSLVGRLNTAPWVMDAPPDGWRVGDTVPDAFMERYLRETAAEYLKIAKEMAKRLDTPIR